MTDLTGSTSRDHEITGRTQIYAHIAHPSSQVRTPQIFNSAFHAHGIDAVAISIDAAPPDLRAVIGCLRGWRNLAGAGVTMPHKEAVVTEVDELVGAARQIGAVNVIRRDPDGRLVGANTDGQGFAAGLQAAGHALAGRDSLLIGAGGAARAIAWTLAQAQVSQLAIANRTRYRAELLARQIAEAFPQLRITPSGPDPAGHDLVINATPLGLHEFDPLPIDVERLTSGTLVVDIVITSAPTHLLHEAHNRGCPTHRGDSMLSYQVDAVLDFLRLRPQ